MPTLAALATVPGRESSLAQCLASLRPQVDELRVVCHDVKEPPPCVRDLADAWICEPDTRGSAAKLHWARSWTGLYLGCDDDLRYPADYAATMSRWVKRWKGHALCCIGGRIFRDHANVYPAGGEQAGYPVGGNDGQWVNYPNAAGLAFDTRLNVPSRIPEKNQEEAYLTLWAQRHRVPIWLVPKPKGWLAWLLDATNPGPTIWASEKRDRYSVRNRLMRGPARNGWVLSQGYGQNWPPPDEPFDA